MHECFDTQFRVECGQCDPISTEQILTMNLTDNLIPRQSFCFACHETEMFLKDDPQVAFCPLDVKSYSLRDIQ